MWNPINISMYNLFAHKESCYVFKNNTCTVIFGENNDDRGLQNNGSGKTTLFEAISIALTGESLRGVKKESFINREADDCKIIFCLENAVMRMNLRIERQFFRGNKSSKVAIYENDVLNTQIVSVNDANKRISELIGISRDDLMRYFIISQDNHYIFFTSSDSDKKEIMNRITSADMINPIIERLDSRFKRLEAEYKRINDEISKLSDKKELLEEQRQEMLSNDISVAEIKKVLANKKRLEDELLSINQTIENNLAAASNLDARLAKMSKIDVAKMSVEKKQIQTLLDTLESEIHENNKVIKKLENELASIIVCPHCQSEFIPDSQLNLTPDEIHEAINQLNEEKKLQCNKLSKNEHKLDKIKQDIAKAEVSNDVIDELTHKKGKLQRQLINAQETMTETVEKIRACDEQVKNLKEREKDNKILENLKERISECDKQLEMLIERLQDITSKIDMVKFWQFNMGKNGFSTYLANKSIKIIEGITNSFLRKFDVDLSVLMNGFTILRSGEVREKIDVFIQNDGITAEQFMSKSGGERGRVTLAGILGIQQLINMSTNGRGLNFLALDEVFPGIDAMGQENIIKTLEGLGITIMLITQNVSESFNNENTLYVIKTNGESRYVAKKY